MSVIPSIGESTNPQPIPKPLGSQILQKIIAIFQMVVDILKMIGYALLHAVYFVITYSPFSQDNVICKTTNYAKLADIPAYVKLQRNPVQMTQREQRIAKLEGLTPDATHFIPSPYSQGNCFGNTLVFLKTWLETGDIEQVAKEFKGGSPLEGAILQEKYLMLGSVYKTWITERLIQMVQTYPLISMAQEKKLWSEKGYGEALIILDAVEAYLKAGRHPKEGNFEYALTEWIKVHHNEILCEKFLATCREVSQNFTTQNLAELSIQKAVIMIADLEIEYSFPNANGAKDILKATVGLDSGAYKLSLPMYSGTGNFVGLHSIGLIIDSDKCYFLDSNTAIGWCKKSDLQQTVGKLFTQYTGFDYSQNLNGTQPSKWTKAGNFLLEQSNPPASIPSHYFELHKIIDINH